MMAKLDEIILIKKAVEAQLLQYKGVTGVDVGYKYVCGQKTSILAIRVLVAEKRDVPENERIPATIEGIPTDVIQRTFQLHVDTAKYDPLRGGCSVGPCRTINGNVYAGTLGLIVEDNTTSDLVCLSNFHVLCVNNGCTVGDDITQPSRLDAGVCPGDKCGDLIRSVLSAHVDGAICSVTGRGTTGNILDIGPVTGSASAILGSGVRKRGRTTGLTYGIVDSVSLTVILNYGFDVGIKTLYDQIGILPDTNYNPAFGDHGDSGSVVVDGARRVVGLYFAGAINGYGVANPISYVLSELNIALQPSSSRYLRRAVFGAPQPGQGVSHASGSRFAFLDPHGRGMLKVPLDPSWIGKTLYFKFPAFNQFGGGLQSLAGLPAYTYTPIDLGNIVNLTYTVEPNPCLSQPVGQFKVNLAQVTVTFPTNAVNYNARQFTVADPGAGNTVIYYVTIYDPGYVGDTGAQTNLTAYCETNQSKVGIVGYTYLGSIYVTHNGGDVIVTLGGWPPPQGFLVNGE